MVVLMWRNFGFERVEWLQRLGIFEDLEKNTKGVVLGKWRGRGDNASDFILEIQVVNIDF